MVIKSMSRKTKSFKQLLVYLNSPAERGESPLFFNLQEEEENNIDNIEKEFMENSRFCPARKNGVYLYHEILSFSEADKNHISEEILTDLAEYYLQLRSPDCLAYGIAHFNRENPHIHLIISANRINSRKKARISKSRFSRIKREVEAYQRKHYPQLCNSLVQGRGKKREKRQTKQAEFERKKRLKKENKPTVTRKEKIKKIVLQALLISRNEKSFISSLRQENLIFYQRGKTPGIQDEKGRKYRFKTLGILADFTTRKKEWSRKKYRKDILIQLEAQKKRVRFRGFKKAVLGVLSMVDFQKGNQFLQINRKNYRNVFRGRGR